MMRDEREARNEIAAAGETGMRPKPSMNGSQRIPSPYMGLEGQVLEVVLAPVIPAKAVIPEGWEWRLRAARPTRFRTSPAASAICQLALVTRFSLTRVEVCIL